MFLANYKTEPYSFHAAKFALSIVLDSMGECTASEETVLFLNSKGINISREQYDRKNAEVQKALKLYKCGMVEATVRYLWDTPVLRGKEAGNRAGYSYLAKSLEELVGNSSPEELYARTMRLLSSVEENHLIQEYIKTKHFKRYFFNRVKQNYRFSQDNIRENNLTDAVLEELLDDFYEWVGYYSSNGSYAIESGTPVPFLLNTFGYYVNSSGGKFYQILNQRGSAFSLGGDSKDSFIDTVGINLNREGGELNFLRVCRQIHRASYLLFKHSDNKIAFYDIFSYHRDLQLKQTVVQVMPELKKIKGCTINYDDNTSYLANGFIASVNAKKAGRLALCEKLEDIVNYGIRREDLYGLYVQLLAITEKLSKREGARLFATVTHKTKHIESNGQIFQILVDGYLALRELLTYLSNNDCGVSINTFPVDIFRDEMFLRRFTNLNDYVQFIPEVRKLVQDVRNDSERSEVRDKETGILDNDSVYDIMLSQKLLNNSVFMELKTLPLSIITSAVSEISRGDNDAKLYDDIISLRNLFIKFVPGGCCRTDNLKKVKYGMLMSYFIERTDAVIRLKDQAELTPAVCIAVITFCNCLQCVLDAEKHAMLDEDGCFCVDGELSVLDYFSYVDELVAEYRQVSVEFAEALAKNKLRRVIAIHFVYKLLFGKDKCSDYSCKLWDLRNALITSDLLQSYVDEVGGLFCNIYGEKRDLYLILARLMEKEYLLRIPQVITDCREISFLSQATPKYWLGGTLHLEDSMYINKEKNNCVVRAFNRLFGCMSGIFNIFRDIEERANQCIKESSFVVDLTDKRVLRQLLKANLSLIGCATTDNSKEEIMIQQQLESRLNFNEDNYALMNRKLFCIDSNKYVHRFGFVVEVDVLSDTFIIHRVTEQEINLIDSVMILGV